ncbi:MAG: hypothetical protein GQ541_00025 [Desulfovibrionaceae bacterium]|jgi:hypothetical protein|nr:hypothetical protein [Desulfovibrionaceae bacterium]
MKTVDDIWEDIGSLSDDEMFHVITKLFDIYDNELKQNPANSEALNFFKNLDNVISQTSQCNSNRR